MMIDQIFDRDYQSARTELNDGIRFLASRAAGSVAAAFQVLNRIEYDAPWRERRRRIRRV